MELCIVIDIFITLVRESVKLSVRRVLGIFQYQIIEKISSIPRTKKVIHHERNGSICGDSKGEAPL